MRLAVKITTLLTALTVVCLMIGSANAATIALYDFENYAVNSTGNGAPPPAVLSTDPRSYNNNTSLLTGITSVSPITLTVTDGTVSDQNLVQLANSSNRYRWRLMNAPATASFSVEIAPGYQMENFSVSMIQYTTSAGTIDVTYNGNAMGPQGALDTGDTLDANSFYETDAVAGPVTGMVTFVITVDPTTNNRTSRWDDFTLTGDIVPVPEPASLAMLGFGGICLVALRVVSRRGAVALRR